ncbi:high-affinity choline transporter, putative, partial [Ixodes scapularis]
ILILPTAGATVNVVTGLDPITAMSLSATVAVLYTALGGLYSVRYTDIVQLTCILVGMVRVFRDCLLRYLAP